MELERPPAAHDMIFDRPVKYPRVSRVPCNASGQVSAGVVAEEGCCAPDSPDVPADVATAHCDVAGGGGGVLGRMVYAMSWVV